MVQKSIVEWFSADEKRTTFFYNEYGLVFRNSCYFLDTKDIMQRYRYSQSLLNNKFSHIKHFNI